VSRFRLSYTYICQVDFDGGAGTSGRLSSAKVFVVALPGTYSKPHQRECNVNLETSCTTMLTRKIYLGWTLVVVSILGCQWQSVHAPWTIFMLSPGTGTWILNSARSWRVCDSLDGLAFI
jgi:hypothetical protein